MHTVPWACSCRAKANMVSWVPFSLPPWAIRGGFQTLSYVAPVLFVVYRCGKKSSKQHSHEIPVASAVSILPAARFSFSSLRSRKYAAAWISSVRVAWVLDDISWNCSPGLYFPLLPYHIQIWPCSLKNFIFTFSFIFLRFHICLQCILIIFSPAPPSDSSQIHPQPLPTLCSFTKQYAEFNLCCQCKHGCGVFRWKGIDLLGATT